MDTLKSISLSEVLNKITSVLNKGNLSDSSQRTSILTEYIRKSLQVISLEMGDQIEYSPVYVTRLKNRVVQLLECVWPDLSSKYTDQPFDDEEEDIERSDEIGKLMNFLELIGDVVHLGRGFWLPAPLRIIKLPEENYAILGGLATSDIKKLFPNIQAYGLGRFLLQKPKEKQYVNYYQEYKEWIGWVPDDIRPPCRRRGTIR